MDTRRLNPYFFATQIHIPTLNKYLGCGYKILSLCRNNGWKGKHVQGTRCTKIGADSWAENTLTAPEFILSICRPKPENSEFQWKEASSGVRGPWIHQLQISGKKSVLTLRLSYRYTHERIEAYWNISFWENEWFVYFYLHQLQISSKKSVLTLRLSYRYLQLAGDQKTCYTLELVGVAFTVALLIV